MRLSGNQSNKLFSRKNSAAILFCAILTVAAGSTLAWHGEGHELAVRKAVASTGDDLPEFFRNSADVIAQYSNEPDLFTKPIAPPELHDAEHADHYFDLERLEGEPPPAGRYEMLAWCYKKGISPDKIGLAPYAIQEWTQKLEVAFAEYRKWPDDAAIRQKILVYAGFLSHYAADVCQPLHTTVNYDGRADEKGMVAKTGIHKRLDAMLGKLPVGVEIKIEPAEIKPFDKLFEGIIGQIFASHKLVEKVYELDKDIPAYEEPLKLDGPAADFAKDRLRAAAVFTARLYATAWRDSANIKLPEWHRRSATQPAEPEKK